MKYLSVQREKSRKYSQSWQRQHAADELKTVAAAVNYLSELQNIRRCVDIALRADQLEQALTRTKRHEQER